MGEHDKIDGGAESVGLREALEERYLAYALSTIMHRALPDVRDGLKPVHRRLLYAMQQLKLDPEGGFKKCARVVGDVIGKFHPHGDQAVYDALVRLAQDFAVRYPLIEGQGNFGNIDGDNAAAMRYTEAKLTDVAAALLEHIGDDTVDFRETYDGEESEPVVLPANFPNVLANGASGIAVGMATNIPPHNAGELCDAALHLIKYPNARVEKLVEYVPGPDLPTGGIIVEPKDSIIEAYKTGRGGFRVRARWEKEDLGRGSYQIVVTEIPYQVQKARLIEKIADLMQAKKLPLLADIRDESAEEIRLVLEPKNRTVEPEILMESLFKVTDLEARVPLNMNVLSRGKIPNVDRLRQRRLFRAPERAGGSARFARLAARSRAGEEIGADPASAAAGRRRSRVTGLAIGPTARARIGGPLAARSAGGDRLRRLRRRGAFGFSDGKRRGNFGQCRRNRFAADRHRFGRSGFQPDLFGQAHRHSFGHRGRLDRKQYPRHQHRQQKQVKEDRDHQAGHLFGAEAQACHRYRAIARRLNRRWLRVARQNPASPARSG